MAGPPFVEGRDRGAVLEVHGYEVSIDLSHPGGTFRSRSVVSFGCRRHGAAVIADLDAVGVERAALNGAGLDFDDLWRDGRLELPGLATENVLVVEAVFGYAGGTGMHRVAGGDRPECVYGKGNRGGAPRMFCCFDQPDLRAPVSLTVRVPDGWSCLANSPLGVRPGTAGQAGVWRFAPTPRVAPYLVAFCAGDVGRPATSADGPVPLAAWAPAGGDLGVGPSARAARFLDLAGRFLDHYVAIFGGAFPFAKLDLVFVPELVPLAFTAPGLALLQEGLLEPAADEPESLLACIAAHETVHTWFGGVIDLRSEADMWLQEALATYVSRAALELLCPGTVPWDVATSSVLPDDAYAAGAGIIRRLEALIGRPAVLGGLAEIMRTHRFDTVTVDDLVCSWSSESGRDLGDWAAAELPPAGGAGGGA